MNARLTVAQIIKSIKSLGYTVETRQEEYRARSQFKGRASNNVNSVSRKICKVYDVKDESGNRVKSFFSSDEGYKQDMIVWLSSH